MYYIAVMVTESGSLYTYTAKVGDGCGTLRWQRPSEPDKATNFDNEGAIEGVHFTIMGGASGNRARFFLNDGKDGIITTSSIKTVLSWETADEPNYVTV